MTHGQPVDVERDDPTLDQGPEDYQSTAVVSADEAELDVTDLIEGKFYKLDHLEPYEEIEREIVDVDLVQFLDRDDKPKLDKDGTPEKPKPQLTLDDGKILSCGVLNSRALVRGFGHKKNIR